MKSINLILGILLGMSIVAACGMGGKPYKKPERKEQDKLFRPCQDFETSDPVGKLCNKVCIDRKGSECKAWKINVKNFSDPEIFKWFRAGSFVMIDEDQVL
jgi:hypothetical protein